MLAIEALPAERGDCLLIEYGDDPKDPYRILIDCGPPVTYPLLVERLKKIPETKRHFELFVVTHVDDDHIGGALSFLKDVEALGITFGDVWFNGWEQMSEDLSVKQGEKLSEGLETLGVPWNAAFRTRAEKTGRPVYGEAVVVPASGALPRVELADGLALTLVSPTREKLAELAPLWHAYLEKAGLLGAPATGEDEEIPDDALLGGVDVEVLASKPDRKDPSEANGSSIAFILEYGAVRWLLTGDAHHDVLEDGLQRFAKEQGITGRVPLDLFKVSHHGSRNNVTRSLLERMHALEYLVCSDGAKFQHPNDEAISKILKWGAQSAEARVELHFNYTTKFNEGWASSDLGKTYNYVAKYPAPGKMGRRLVWKGA